MAIVLALLAACLWAIGWSPAARPWLVGVMAGLGLVAGIGWWDDHRPLSARLRLGVHAVASLWLGWLVWRASGEAWMGALTALAAVVLINVWNFMDGINGLAASQAALAAAGFACWLPDPWSWAGWALVAGCLGFLPFNFPRARIFLGDGGSGALGYALAALLGLCLARGGSPGSLWLPLGVFLVDAGFTLAARMLSGQRWWEPHAQHVYQALARRFGHTVVTLAYACFGIVAIVLFFRLQEVQPGWEAAGSIVWLLAASTVWLLLRKGLRKF